MNIQELKLELFDITTEKDEFRKWVRVGQWFNQHVLQLGVSSSISLDMLKRDEHDKNYLKYHRANIIHKIAETLIENKSVTETKLIPNYPDDKWGLYEQRTESKLWVLK